MRTLVIAVLLVLAFLWATFVLASVIAADRAARNPLPRCSEDAVLVGTGSFENGRWDRYVCGPAVDDFKA